MINKEEIDVIGWLSALEVNSEYEASNKEILLSYIDKTADIIKELEKERDYYKTLYEKYSNVFIEGGKKLTED